MLVNKVQEKIYVFVIFLLAPVIKAKFSLGLFTGQNRPKMGPDPAYDIEEHFCRKSIQSKQISEILKTRSRTVVIFLILAVSELERYIAQFNAKICFYLDCYWMECFNTSRTSGCDFMLQFDIKEEIFLSVGQKLCQKL